VCDADGAHSGHGGDALADGAENIKSAGTIATPEARVEFGDKRVVGVDAGVGGDYVAGHPGEEARADHEGERQCDLRDDERVTRQPAAAMVRSIFTGV